MQRVFVDTSAWYAHANRRAPQHDAVRGVLARRNHRLVTSNYVFDETVTLVAIRLGHAAALAIGGALRSSERLDIVRLTAEDERAAWTLFGQRPDKDYGFTDCTSFVVMKRLGIETAVALDDDFRREGFDVVP